MRVLLIENDPSSEGLLRRMIAEIEERGPAVVASLGENSDDFDAIEPDIALIAHAPPRADAIALTRRLRANEAHRGTPIMILGADDRETRIAAFEAGANDVLAKPIEPIEAMVRIRNLFQIRDAQLALADRAEALAREVGRVTQELEAREEEIVSRLTRAAAYRDVETADHIVRMAKYCGLIAEALGFERETSRFLHLAAHMHDIGKLGVPDAILRKPGDLTSDERVRMEMHTTIGEQILEGSASPLIQLAAVMAGSHHERWNGAGYPRALAGLGIPVAGRIAAVADVFDALTSARTYKSGWSLDAARQFLVDERGRQFDPACVDALLSRWDEVVAIAAAD